MKMKGLVKWTVLILLLLFCIQTVSAISVSSVTIDPSGSLTPGTPVTVSFKIENSGVFPSDNELQLFTELGNPKWTYTIIVNGFENLRPVMGGRTLDISGFELNYKSSDQVSVRVGLEGVAPTVTQTSNKTLVRITQYDGNGKPIASTHVDKSAMIINTAEVSSIISSRSADLQVYRIHIDEAAVIGINTAGAELKYNEAKQKIDSARSRPSNQYAAALSDLNAATAAIVAGEKILDKAQALPSIIPIKEEPTIVQTSSTMTAPTTSQTMIGIPTLTSTPDYDAKIAALEKQLAEQNQKIEQQGNIIDKIMNFLRNVLGWK